MSHTLPTLSEAPPSAAGTGSAHPAHLLPGASAKPSTRQSAAPLPAGDDAMRKLVESAYAQLEAGRAASALVLLQQAIALRPVASESRAAHSRHGLSVPPRARLALRTLGGFELFVDGVPLAVGKKPARRTLALLKAIIAFGGRDVCRWLIADALWPDVDGDRAQNALEVALHRLRLRLGVPEALRSRQGCLSLTPHLVWVDAFAFCSAAEPVNPGAECEPIERTFALYRGPFLPHDTDCVWSARMRNRLRARFASLVASAAAALESRNRLQEAIRLYERGIAADEAVVAFHDGLARCLGGLGRKTNLHHAPERRIDVMRLQQVAN